MKHSSHITVSAIRGFVGRLLADRRGNVIMILGFAIVPLTMVVGFGVDYGRAMTLQTRLNAAADAAALAAVAPDMIFESNEASTAAATSMFNSQAERLNGFQDLHMTPTVTDGTASSSGGLGFLRKATVAYTAKSTNFFSKVLGYETMTISGSATASAAQPPNVDFYLAMDNSPSMLLPATSDGVAKIIAATTNSHNSNGCAFACHAKIPHSDNIYINDTSDRQILLSTGYFTSGSEKEGVYYRWDTSTNTLYDSDGNSMNSSDTSVDGPHTTTDCNWVKNKYGNWVKVCNDYDETVTTVTTTTYSITDSTNDSVKIKKTVASTPTTVRTPVGGGYSNTTKGSTSSSTSNYDTGYWADGYWLTHNYGEIYGSPAKIVLRKDDVVSAASQLIPFASNQASEYHVTYRMQMFSFDWTRSGQSSPVKQLSNLTDVSTYSSGFSVESLFPADDYWWKNSMPTSSTNINDQATEMANMLTAMNSTIPIAGTGAPGATPQKIFFLITDGMIDQPGGSRYFGPLRSNELSQCTAIKAKGIKIAILYTQYLPESLVGDSWSQSNVAPFLPSPPSPYPAGNSGSSDRVLTALQSCASPGTNGAPLVQTVTADDDITTALQQLFSTALQAARLVR
jgi:Flp pilus assembly protein TadG